MDSLPLCVRLIHLSCVCAFLILALLCFLVLSLLFYDIWCECIFSIPCNRVMTSLNFPLVLTCFPAVSIQNFRPHIHLCDNNTWCELKKLKFDLSSWFQRFSQFWPPLLLGFFWCRTRSWSLANQLISWCIRRRKVRKEEQKEDRGNN